MNLIIDIGNTRVKIAVFEQEEIVEQSVFKIEELLQKIHSLQLKYSIQKGIVSSVVDLSNTIIDKLSKEMNFLLLSNTINVPFKNNYKTPKTLGLDRIALVAGAIKKYPKRNCLIIDAGTCVTYDFLDEQGVYHGGAISPGLKMRYNSLFDYTSKLPKLSLNTPNAIIGSDTESSIHSGVVNGIVFEIDGVINQYKYEYQDLTVVLTGGDNNFLSKQLKNSIFATQNLVLEGLNIILNFNN